MKSWKMIATGLIAASMTTMPLFARPQPDGQEHFQRIDVDGNGQISEQEWFVYQTERFKELDADGDGVVSKQEIRKRVRSMNRARSDDDEEMDREPPPEGSDSGGREGRE